jgi:hypothetical protein
MGDDIRITVIATGFERSGVPRRILRPNRHAEEKKSIAHFIQPNQESVSVGAALTPAPQQKKSEQTFSNDDLDIPTFLRNRR